MANATSSGRAPGACVDDAVAALVREKQLSLQTLVRLEALMRQFGRFVEDGLGISNLADVSTHAVERYIAAPTACAPEPGPSIRYFRRLAVRTLYRVLRAEGVEVGDPTLDLVLPSRQPGAFRPLVDDEVALCRAACVGTSKRNRAAAAWALAEATARTGELPSIRRGDVDLEHGRVWIIGSERTVSRSALLTPWGHSQLARFLATSPGAAEDGVLYATGEPASALAQSSAVGAISRTLTRAGLGDAPDVRPSSVAAWAGWKVFEETGQIDVTAQRLGMRSLDRTARFIGWDWAPRGD
ncbi:MAG: xerC [Actinomycetia bacterium]|nr:xerC [Actinomycetes bacterium]